MNRRDGFHQTNRTCWATERQGKDYDTSLIGAHCKAKLKVSLQNLMYLLMLTYLSKYIQANQNSFICGKLL